ESTVLKAFGATKDGLSTVAWYSDEHPLSLGVRKISDAKNKLIVYCQSVVDGFGEPATGATPAVGCTEETRASDPSGRAIRPLLFWTDLGKIITDPDGTQHPEFPDNREGDWQQPPGNGA